MTLLKYRLAYSECTLKEVVSFIVDRDIECESNDFMDMCVALCDADRYMTFRFLDLPSLVRNMVYDLALDVKEVNDGSYRSIKANLALLATCKQIHREVVALAGRKASYPLNFTYDASNRIVQIHGNGRPIATLLAGQGHLKTPEIRWPHVLKKLTSLTVGVHFVTPAPEKGRSGSHTASKHLNGVLEQLHRAVSWYGKSKLCWMHIKIKSDLQLSISDRELQGIVSPLCVIASDMSHVDYTFDEVSHTLQLSLRETVTARRKIHSLRRELEKILKGKADENGNIDGIWWWMPVSKSDGLLMPKKPNGISIYANEVELQEAISDLESMLEHERKNNADSISNAIMEETESAEMKVGSKIDE